MRELGPRRPGAGRSSDDQDVLTLLDALDARAQGLAQAATNPVPRDGFANATAHRNAHPRAVEIIGRHVEDQESMRPAATGQLAHMGELGRSPQALLPLHDAARWRSPPSGGWLNDSQALAPAQAAALEDGTSGGAEHAFEEAVLPSARDTLGLIRTLGHGASVLGRGGPFGARLGTSSRRPTPAARVTMCVRVYQRASQGVDSITHPSHIEAVSRATGSAARPTGCRPDR